METKKNITDEKLFDYIYYWKFEHNLGWKFCAGILKLNYDIDISSRELKRRIEKYIKSRDTCQSVPT